MRDFKQLEIEIDRIRESRLTLKKPREISSANKRLALLTTCVGYLKTQPQEDFVEKEYERLNKKLTAIEKSYEDFKSKKTTLKEKRVEFERVHDIKKIREQLRVLLFILN